MTMLLFGPRLTTPLSVSVPPGRTALPSKRTDFASTRIVPLSEPTTAPFRLPYCATALTSLSFITVVSPALGPFGGASWLTTLVETETTWIVAGGSAAPAVGAAAARAATPRAPRRTRARIRLALCPGSRESARVPLPRHAQGRLADGPGVGDLRHERRLAGVEAGRVRLAERGRADVADAAARARAGDPALPALAGARPRPAAARRGAVPRAAARPLARAVRRGDRLRAAARGAALEDDAGPRRPRRHGGRGRARPGRDPAAARRAVPRLYALRLWRRITPTRSWPAAST